MRHFPCFSPPRARAPLTLLHALLPACRPRAQSLLLGKSTEMGIKAIESLDEFLTGCASLVFGMGLYELFISKMHIADPDEDPEAHARAHKGGFNIGHRPQWLALEGLGDLKHRTGAVIIMVRARAGVCEGGGVACPVPQC